MKILSPLAHGYVDYLAVAFLFAAPALFDFAPDPARISYALGVIHLIISLITRYPLGLIKRVPFPVHGTYELLLAILLVLLPWIANFEGQEVARNVYVISGIALFVVWVITSYKYLPTDSRHGLPHSPHHSEPRLNRV